MKPKPHGGDPLGGQKGRRDETAGLLEQPGGGGPRGSKAGLASPGSSPRSGRATKAAHARENSPSAALAALLLKGASVINASFATADVNWHACKGAGRRTALGSMSSSARREGCFRLPRGPRLAPSTGPKPLEHPWAHAGAPAAATGKQKPTKAHLRCPRMGRP